MTRVFQPHVVTSDSAAGGQIIDGSLKFNIGRTNYMKRSPTSDGNKRVWTSSFWIKRTRLGVQQKILEAGFQILILTDFQMQLIQSSIILKIILIFLINMRPLKK